jgi:hypothetical protein
MPDQADWTSGLSACPCQLADRIRDGPLTIGGPTQVYQRRAGGAVAHPFHQLSQVGTGHRAEDIARVPQIVQMDPGPRRLALVRPR